MNECFAAEHGSLQIKSDFPNQSLLPWGCALLCMIELPANRGAEEGAEVSLSQLEPVHAWSVGRSPPSGYATQGDAMHHRHASTQQPCKLES